ncbi:TolC family protein [Paraglaciecola polaris]|uniref:TolC family protein n=1 Tax=Paraglaciecola polaris TaxID=222814 RepID=UPI0030EDF4B6
MTNHAWAQDPNSVIAPLTPHSTSPASILTLSGAIKRTLANNPQLATYTFQQQALDGERTTAQLDPQSSISIEIENVLGTGERSGVKGAELTLALSSVLELGGKKDARNALISQKRQLLAAQKQAQSLDLLADVTRRYIDALSSEQRVTVLKEAEALARYTLQAVKKRVAAGATPEVEQFRAQSALAKARMRLLNAQRQRTANHYALSILWGETTPSFSTLTGNIFALGSSQNFDSLYRQAVNNPAIEVFSAQERLQQAHLRLAKTQAQSDLTWSVGVRYDNASDDGALVAGLSMPLFGAARSLGEYQSIQAKRAQLDAEKSAALLTLSNQLYQLVQARESAVLRVNTLNNDIIPPLNTALKQVRQAYEEGRYSYLEWVTTRQELIDAKAAMISAAQDALTLAADIEQLTGNPLISSTPSSASH